MQFDRVHKNPVIAKRHYFIHISPSDLFKTHQNTLKVRSIKCMLCDGVIVHIHGRGRRMDGEVVDL